MIEEAEGRRLDDGGAARNIYISATDGGVAAYRIDQVIVDGLAELQAATTVLPLDALVVEPTPFVGRQSELTRIADLLSVSDADPSSSIVVVSGPPGVGKTALVRQAATVAAAAEAAGPSVEEPIVELLLGGPDWQRAISAQRGCFSRAEAGRRINGS